MYKFIIVFLAFSLNALGGTASNLKLKQIDEFVHKEPRKSKALLQSIEKENLSTGDKELYTFLTAYLLATSAQLDKAIIMLLPLTEKTTSTTIQVRSHSLLLLIYAGTHDWEGGLNILDKLNKIVEDKNGESVSEAVYSNIVNFYNLLGEHEIAKKYADKLIGSFKTDSNKCTLYTQQIYAELKLDFNTLSEQKFIDVINYCKSSNSSYAIHGAYIYLVEFLIEKKQFVDAEKILLDNLQEVEDTGYHTMTASFYAKLSEIKLFKEQYVEAEFYARKIIDEQHEHQSAQSLVSAYEVLSKVMEKQQIYDQAFNYYKQYSDAKQLNLDQNNAKLLAIQKAKFNAVEKNARIALLDKENALLKTQVLLDNESAQNRRLAVALLTMALVMFILWAYKNRKTYIKMRYFAQTDELTGIANRHHFAELADSAIKLCKKTDQPVSFVMFDLDFFKNINDSYGHIVGDQALKMAVNAAKSACRKNDIIGRLGGEEFGILLTGCGNHLASHIAEKCRQAIEKVDTSDSGHQFTLTASFGVSDSSVCDYEFTALFAGADKALYRSKDLGRNQIFNYQENFFAVDM